MWYEQSQTLFVPADRHRACGIGYRGASFTNASVHEDYSAFQERYAATIKDNYTQVALTPGVDETQLNVSYYSPLVGVPATPVVKISKNADMSDSTEFHGRNAIAIDGYVSNYITVTGLEENTTYYYTTMCNGEESEINVYQTPKYSEGYTFLFVGDPQIGSGGCCNDAYHWNRTLEIARERHPDLSFILSAGDQVANEAGGTGNTIEMLGDEEEFAAYLSADALRSLPVAPVVGNHDAHLKANDYHYFVPNKTDYGITAGGSDYYFSYGDALFIVLNLNNYD